jgi:hypothetical protein
MTKYYRVKKDNFIWKEGAILTDQDEERYIGIEDIWNTVTGVKDEYISARIIEHPDNHEYFERVYPDTITGKLYRTKDQMVEMYKKAFT